MYVLYILRRTYSSINKARVACCLSLSWQKKFCFNLRSSHLKVQKYSDFSESYKNNLKSGQFKSLRCIVKCLLHSRRSNVSVGGSRTPPPLKQGIYEVNNPLTYTTPLASAPRPPSPSKMSLRDYLCIWKEQMSSINQHHRCFS